VPSWLQHIARRCLEKSPDLRFDSARALQAALASGNPPPRAPVSAPPPGHAGVAVLPFLDLDGDGGQAYLCHGLAEELIHALASANGFRVDAPAPHCPLQHVSARR